MLPYPQNGQPEECICRLRAVVRYLHTVVQPDDALLVALSNRLEAWVSSGPAHVPAEPASVHPALLVPRLEHGQLSR